MMLKRKSFLLSIFVGFCLTVVAQTPVTSLPYFCGFEDINENANWTLNRRGGIGASTPLASRWNISTGGRHTGLNGLYICTDVHPDAAEYDGAHEVFAVAEREFSLQPGAYDLAFDWRCLGDESSDAIFVYWVPVSTAASLSSRTNSTLPTAATPLVINGSDHLSGSASWKQVRTTVMVNSTQNYRLIFAWRNNTTNTYNPGGCLDNVQIQRQEQPTDCWHSVSGMTWTQGQSSDVLSWNGSTDATYDIFYWMEGDFRMDSIIGVSGNSYTFIHGDLNSGLYSFAIRTDCGDDQSIQIELLNVKSLGDYSLIAEACPDVSLIAQDIVDGEKVLRPMCDENGQFRVKPNTVAGGGSIAGYRVDPIDYSECPFPFEYRLAQLLMGGSGSGNYLRLIRSDDVWDNQVLTLPFKVCYFEGTYSQAVVCSNGIVSFDTQVLGHAAGYSLTGQPDIPSAGFGQAPGNGYYWRNAIYGVFQDYDPYYGGEIWYGVLGEWPCRKMVVCWNEVPMFNNHSTVNSSMIVMYEGTNVIDVYVKNRDLSPSGWNDNRGIIGLQNADGSDGVAAPGRNTNDGDQNRRAWSAHNEAWRFSPYSTPAFALTWYKGAFTTPAAIDDYIRQHPDEQVELALADSLNITKEDSIDAVTVRLQYSQCNGDYIDIIDRARIVWPRVDTLVVDTFTCFGRPYNDRYINRADTAGPYEVIIPDSYGCDSIFYHLNLRLLEKTTATIDTTICPGQLLDYQGIRVGEEGVWPVTLKYKNCDCDSVTEYINLSVLEKLDVDLVDFPDRICGDDSILSFLLESSISDARYSLHFEPAGAGFEDVADVEMDELSSVLVKMSGEVVPGWYTMYYDVEDPACGFMHDSVRFLVNYPASIAPQKWNNVLVLLDTENNGGYAFSSIKWYKNGQQIGETDQTVLYLEGESFDPDAEYTVGLVRFGESEEIISCPLGDYATGFDRVDTPADLPLVFDGQMIVYDVLGRVVIQSSYDHAALTQWLHSNGQPAVYLVRLSSKDADFTYRFLSR